MSKEQYRSNIEKYCPSRDCKRHNVSIFNQMPDPLLTVGPDVNCQLGGCLGDVCYHSCELTNTKVNCDKDKGWFAGLTGDRRTECDNVYYTVMTPFTTSHWTRPKVSKQGRFLGSNDRTHGGQTTTWNAYAAIVDTAEASSHESVQQKIRDVIRGDDEYVFRFCDGGSREEWRIERYDESARRESYNRQRYCMYAKDFN